MEVGTMRIVKEISVREFKPWGGAVMFYSRLNTHELNLLDDYFDDLCDWFGSIDETTINDMLWFDNGIIIRDIFGGDYDEFYNRVPLR